MIREPRILNGFEPKTDWSVVGDTLTLHASAVAADGKIKGISYALVDLPELKVSNTPAKVARELLDKLKEACK